MKRTTWLAACLITAGLLTTACSSGDSGTTGDAAPSTTAAAVDPTLRVPAPLSVGNLAADPCQGLSADQAAAIGLKAPGAVTDGSAGPSCRFESVAYDLNKIYIAPLSTQNTGISGLYANRASAKYFEPTNIGGYPAVFSDAADVRSRGTCALWVGVTDELAVGVTSSIVTGPNVTNPCPIVEEVAKAMVQHLKGVA